MRYRGLARCGDDDVSVLALLAVEVNEASAQEGRYFARGGRRGGRVDATPKKKKVA